MARGSAPRRRVRSIGARSGSAAGSTSSAASRSIRRRRREPSSRVIPVASRVAPARPVTIVHFDPGEVRSSSGPAEARTGPTTTVGAVGRVSRGASPTALPRTERDAPSAVTSSGSGTVDTAAAGGDGVGSSAAAAGSSAATPRRPAAPRRPWAEPVLRWSRPASHPQKGHRPERAQRSGRRLRVQGRPVASAATRRKSGRGRRTDARRSRGPGWPPRGSSTWWRLHSSAQPVPRACHPERP